MNDYRNDRMKIIPKSIDIGEYLRSSAVIDFMNESVSGLADTLFEKSGNKMDDNYYSILNEYIIKRSIPIYIMRKKFIILMVLFID